MTDRFHVIIAGGKTGGHLFPGIAVAQALKRKQPTTQIRFVGTNAPFETQTVKTYGFDHLSIFSRPLKGRSLVQKLTGTAAILVSLAQSFWILWRFKPDFVLGVGGYSSFAVVLAAWLLRVPTAIQEQNAFPGITNRMLARFCTTIFTAFESTRGFSENPKTVVTGNPVREQGAAVPTETSWISDIDSTDFVLLVTGGSREHPVSTGPWWTWPLAWQTSRICLSSFRPAPGMTSLSENSCSRWVSGQKFSHFFQTCPF